MKRLLILGNGFDLQAGLKTAYKDFFLSSEKPLIEKWSKDTSSVDGSQVSLISLLLYNTFFREPIFLNNPKTFSPYQVNYQFAYKKALGLEGDVENWMDVEDYLARVLASHGFVTLSKCFDENFLRRGAVGNGICEYDDVPTLMRTTRTAKGYFYDPSFYEFFLNELKIFETRFANYIQEQLDANEDYVKNAKQILASIIPFDISDNYIINFNYTIVDKKMFNSNGDKRIINVHGTLKESPIIGIDSNKSQSEKTTIFTKTFRKLVGQKESRALDEFDEIIIYGHSLGTQDYSYFQSIFDYVDLYHSNTKVIFYYSDNFIKGHDETDLNNKKNNRRVEMANTLFELVKEYGKTLNNKDNGKNLVHKLLLEGRLKIELRNFIDPKEPAPKEHDVK